LTIVHADLNSQNLMIDTTATKLSIIDLDGGAVARSGSIPIVIGKQNEPGWIAPEIFAQLLRTTRKQVMDVSITTDLWSISCGVHYLLFGLSPFFFVAKRPDIKNYL